MKRRIVVGSGILLILLLAILGYWYFFGGNDRNPIEAVGEESLLLFRLEDPVATWNEVVAKGFWKEWSAIPAVRNAESMLLGLDSLSGQRGAVQNLLKSQNFLASLQPVGKEDLDWLFVWKTTDETLAKFSSAIASKSKGKYSTTTRLYSEVPIFEVKRFDDGKIISFARLDNLVLMSFSSFLLEEAIRNLQTESVEDLQDIYGEFALGNAKPVSVFLTKKGLQGLAEVFSKQDSNPLVFLGLPQRIALMVYPTLDDSGIQFTGQFYSDPELQITEPSEDTRESPNWFESVPSSAVSFTLLNIGPITNLTAATGASLDLNEVLLGELESKLIGKGFFEGFTGQTLEINLGRSGNDRVNQILVFGTTTQDMQSSILGDFAISNSEGVDRSAFVENYRGNEIILIDLDEFPTHLFKANFSGFASTFVTFFEGRMIMANSSGTMREYLDFLISKSGSGTPKPDFAGIKPGKKDVQAYWELDFSNAWSGWLELFNPYWRAFFQKYTSSFLQFDKIQIQMVAEGTTNRVGGRVSLRAKSSLSDQSIPFEESRTVTFTDSLIYGPIVLRNYNDASLEFLLQDRTGKVFLLNEEGEEVFSRMLDGPIVSETFQIDYFKNDKLQLLFATAKGLYAVDRLGELVPGFPLRIPKGEISYLNLVDYENDLNYRFFLATALGEIFLMDKEGNVLDGWSPKSIRIPIASNPTYIRVPGLGDRMFVIDRKGGWHVFNRRGESEPGSPFKLVDEINTEYAIREGNSANESQIVAVSPRGEVVMANFRGEVTERTQLPRLDRESSFHLVKDPKNERFVWIVKGFNQIAVFDESYNELFSQRIDSDQVVFQYFYFGPGKEILVVIDQAQEFVYLYDLAGKMLLERSLPGKLPIEITMPPGKNEYGLYSIYGNQWIEYRLPL